MKHSIIFLVLAISAFISNAQDPNFHIYINFGQSNMEGVAPIEEQDKTVDSRFQVFQSLDCPNLEREKHTWYTAVPPLCNCFSGLSVSDYFGREMVANLPSEVKVGIINVAVGGCDIRLFDKDLYQDHDSTYAEKWFTDKIKHYNGNPYQHLINLAKLAQQDGVIKGILIHQGETNTGDEQWPDYVKKIIFNMTEDLSLAQNIPVLAGEVFQGENNCCSSMNDIINRLPETNLNAHVISSKGCEGMDEAHFSSQGYRTMGRRYAKTMIELIR